MENVYRYSLYCFKIFLCSFKVSKEKCKRKKVSFVLFVCFCLFLIMWMWAVNTGNSQLVASNVQGDCLLPPKPKLRQGTSLAVLLRVGFSRTSAFYRIFDLMRCWTRSLVLQPLSLLRMRTISLPLSHPFLLSWGIPPLCIFLTVLLVQQYILKGVVKKYFVKNF